jgi:endonuclease/exonuclease/phosphatase (EEP) superfamily protein YafD
VRANLSYSTKFDSSYELDSSSIKVLNWNIYKGKKINWDRDFRRLLQKQDIILIQEAYLNRKMINTLDIEKLRWNFATNFISILEDIPTGVLTASKTNPLSSNFLKTKYHEPILKTPKVSLLTKYQLSNSKKVLLIINVHGINFVSLNAFKSQMDDLEKILQKHSGPLIFAGDFNTWKKKRLKVLIEMVKRQNLKSINFKPDFRKTMFGYPLDHIFFVGLEVQDHRVLKHVTSSDHKPMLAEFLLEK